MRGTPFLVLLLLLPLPSLVPAAPPVESAPGWLPGENWKYIIEDGNGKPLNNLTVRVIDERDVRVGNSTVRAYNLTQRLVPYLPPVKTDLSDQVRWGPVYTVVETNITVEKRTLCTLSSEAFIESVHWSDVVVERELITYGPGDGRLRFPLFAGLSWNATFNLTRAFYYPFQVDRENLTVNRRCDCEVFEPVPGGLEGFRVRVTDDSGGTETVFWWGPRQRAEVRREERDPATGDLRVHVLLGHRGGEEPSIFSSPQVLLAILFAAAAAAMLAMAVYTFYRARHPREEREAESRQKASGAPAPSSGRPPPSRPPGRGPGRSI